MSEMLRVMIPASRKDSVAIREKLESVAVMGVTPKTHFEAKLVRVVYTLSDDIELDEFEDAVEDTVKELFPDADIDKRVMIAHLKR